MATKSPTTSVKSREMIGVDQFSQRREVFDKHDTVFLPLPSPTTVGPAYKEVEPIITSNHGKTTSNFKRNTPGYSSMRESRSEDKNYEFRARKYSDNFTSESNQNDDVDYRYTMIERSRRLSKLRRDFLNSNLHDPSESPFGRTGTRASMPANSVSVARYKPENLNIYKFPFAEPYLTPTPVRRVIVDLGSPDSDIGKENKDPDEEKKHQSLPNENSTSPKIDHQKLFEELVKRYSPQRKPIDWTLPPTRPRVVGSVPKSVSSVGSTDQKEIKESNEAIKDDVFENKESDNNVDNQKSEENKIEEIKPNVEILHNGVMNSDKSTVEAQPSDVGIDKPKHSKESLSELEANDDVPELTKITRQLSRESTKRPPLEKIVDLSIPSLIQRMTDEGEQNENHKNNGKKVKRKRSFLDKLLGRNKGIKTEK